MDSATFVAVLFLLGGILCIPGNLGCRGDGAGNCLLQNMTFLENIHCGWTSTTKNGSFFRVKLLDSKRFHVWIFDKSSDGESQFASRLACSTKGEETCLTFDNYYSTSRSIYLSASVVYEDSNQTDIDPTPLWTMRSNPENASKTKTARVPIKTTRNFRVVLEAKVYSERFEAEFVGIGNILYEKYPCFPNPSPATTPTSLPTTQMATNLNITTTTTTTITTTTTTIPMTMAAGIINSTSSADSVSTASGKGAAVTSMAYGEKVYAKRYKYIGLIANFVIGVFVVIIMCCTSALLRSDGRDSQTR